MRKLAAAAERSDARSTLPGPWPRKDGEAAWTLAEAFGVVLND